MAIDCSGNQIFQDIKELTAFFLLQLEEICFWVYDQPTSIKIFLYVICESNHRDKTPPNIWESDLRHILLY